MIAFSLDTTIPCSSPSYIPLYPFAVQLISPLTVVTKYAAWASLYFELPSDFIVKVDVPSFVPGTTVTVVPSIEHLATSSSLDVQLNAPPLIFSITSNVPSVGYVQFPLDSDSFTLPLNFNSSPVHFSPTSALPFV